MADYQKMYATLFREVTRAIDILQKVQQCTEELYISSEESVIKILPQISGDTNEDGDC